MANREKLPRIAIEVDQDLKNKFVKKVEEDGYTIKGLILKWVKKYLSGTMKM